MTQRYGIAVLSLLMISFVVAESGTDAKITGKATKHRLHSILDP